MTSSKMATSAKDAQARLKEADDYHKLKEYYYDRYMHQLRDKILAYERPSSGRHSNNNNNNNAPIAPPQRLEPLKRTENPRAKSRKALHKPLRVAIPKSKRLTMLEAEERLRKAGLLANESELEAFRNKMATIDDLEGYVDDYIRQSTQSASKSRSSSRPQRPLTQIAEVREVTSQAKSRPVTFARKQMDTDLNPHSGNRSMKPADIARAAAVALEKRCPKMDVPNLRCLRPETPGSDEEIELALDEHRAQHKRKYTKRVAYLRLMYQNSQANTAQANRIIDSRGEDFMRENRKTDILANLSSMFSHVYHDADDADSDAVSLLEPPGYQEGLHEPAADLIDLSDTEAEADVRGIRQNHLLQWRENTQSEPKHQINVFTPIAEEPASPELTEASQSRALVPLANQSDGGELTRSEMVEVPAIEAPPTSQALDMSGMAAEVKVIESKALSTYWPNYLKVGKSKFAKA